MIEPTTISGLLEYGVFHEGRIHGLMSFLWSLEHFTRYQALI